MHVSAHVQNKRRLIIGNKRSAGKLNGLQEINIQACLENSNNAKYLLVTSSVLVNVVGVCSGGDISWSVRDAKVLSLTINDGIFFLRFDSTYPDAFHSLFPSVQPFITWNFHATFSESSHPHLLHIPFERSKYHSDRISSRTAPPNTTILRVNRYLSTTSFFPSISSYIHVT